MTEKAEALGVIALAELFHDTYERLAPAYGYETRPETREFNQHSINGRLMIATVRAVKDRLAQQPSAAQSGWQPIETAPDGVEALVYWRNNDGEDMYDFDYQEDGCWMKHYENYEHVQIIGGWGVSEKPPYTHWQPITPPSPAQFKREQDE